MKERIIDSPIICRDYETSGLNQFYDQILTSCAKRYVDGQVVDELYLTSACESHRLPSPIALFGEQLFETGEEDLYVDVTNFVSASIKNLIPNPLVIKDMSKSINRIICSILKNEKI